MAKKKKAKKYHEQRDDFYKKHKYIKYLLGMFIISFAIYLGVQIQNIQKRQFVIIQLIQDGYNPAYADL